MSATPFVNFLVEMTLSMTANIKCTVE